MGIIELTNDRIEYTILNNRAQLVMYAKKNGSGSTTKPRMKVVIPTARDTTFHSKTILPFGPNDGGISMYLCPSRIPKDPGRHRQAPVKSSHNRDQTVPWFDVTKL